MSWIHTAPGFLRRRSEEEGLVTVELLLLSIRSIRLSWFGNLVSQRLPVDVVQVANLNREV